jgi:2-methylcitrate dehydratase
VAADPRLDALREKMTCVEDPQFTAAYHDPERRAIPNGIEVEFEDGRKLEEIVVSYPLGHRFRRNEGIPLLQEKFCRNLALRFPPQRQQAITGLCQDQARLEETPVDQFVDMFVI